MSPPFAIFRGDLAGPSYLGCKSYALVYVPERRVIATFRYADKCRALASELAPTLLRGPQRARYPPGLDGIVINVYQVFAPPRLNQLRDGEVAAKIRADFAKAHSRVFWTRNGI